MIFSIMLVSFHFRKYDESFFNELILMQNIQSGNIIYLTGEGHSEELSGVDYNGVLYYDMSNVRFINNSGIADLIGLVKDWLEQGTEVRFINVNDKIKNIIKEIDLENILYCD